MEIAVIIIVLVLSIIAHEVAHGYAASALGDPTAKLAGRLTLNPIPHIDPLGSVIIPLLLVFSQASFLFGWAKPVPYNPYNLRNQRWGEAMVAVAGSATNILLALIFAFFAHLAAVGILPESAGSFAGTVVLINLVLGIFNLIPLPPMDGYTVLRSLLPYRLSYRLQEFENRMRNAGALGIIAVLLLFLFVLAAPFFHLISLLFRLLVGG